VSGWFIGPAEKSHLRFYAERKIVEIDGIILIKTFKSGPSPEYSFTVPNTLTGEVNLSDRNDIRSMADFSPQAIASKTVWLKQLLRS